MPTDVSAAAEPVEEHETPLTITLNNADRDRFLGALASEERPNAALHREAGLFSGSDCQWQPLPLQYQGRQGSPSCSNRR